MASRAKLAVPAGAPVNVTDHYSLTSGDVLELQNIGPYWLRYHEGTTAPADLSDAHKVKPEQTFIHTVAADPLWVWGWQGDTELKPTDQ